jgi:hypothetical protein
MRSSRFGRLVVSGVVLGVAAVVAVGACGGVPPSGFLLMDGGTDTGLSFHGPLGDASHGGAMETSVLMNIDSGGGGGGHDANTTTMNVCPTGLQCDVPCSGGGSTTVSGKIYDPAGADPLYGIEVYVPSTPLQPLPSGVPSDLAAACSCGSLFESGAVVATTTSVDGSFKLTNVPVGASVPVVAQVGKWRRQFNIEVKACQDNPQADQTLKLPSSITDPNDSMPQIAVSTGGLDTLECLMTRIGLPASEFVAGPGGTGHVHIYSGGQGPNDPQGTGGGSPESPPMTGAPESFQALWDTQAHLMAYDIVLLSCEGDETYNSNSAILEQYLNAGGRAFASHYHYAWFAGSLSGENVPPPPADWGPNLANWQGTGSPNGSAAVVQTLNGSNKPFQKGAALYQWLSSNGALGVEGAASGQLPIFDENGDVGSTVKAQPWLTDDGDTDYMSFDTPVNAPNAPDGGPPAYCGRAVFADIHVDSDPNFPSDSNPPPSGCSSHPLSPQEKALEFMLFDLSSCVRPDTVTVSEDAGLPPPPPMSK